tara:strand:- start:20239 stop:20595 length:357 start_codon:yes stop_codon:yes gene_type:complete
MTRFPAIFGVFLGLFFMLYMLSLEAQSEQKKGQPIEADMAMREYMVDISKQLGVSCNYCHNVNNYKDTSMPTYAISKQHMRIVHMLNTEGFVGKNAMKVDCYMCHQGRAKFKYKMPKD